MTILETNLTETDRMATIIQEKIISIEKNIEDEIARVGSSLLQGCEVASFEFRYYDDYLGHDDEIRDWASTGGNAGVLECELRTKARQVLRELPGMQIPIQSVTGFRITAIDYHII